MRYVLAVFGFVALSLLTAACGKSETPPIQRIEKEKLATIVTGDYVSVLDPHDTDEGANVKVIDQIYETLVRVDPRDINNFIPCLASSWQVAPDGMAITFTLRKGVTFHDGVPVDAASVKLSLDRLLGREFDVPTAPYRPHYDMIAGIEATSMTLTTKLSRKAARIALRNLSMFPASIISPKLLAATRTMEGKAASAHLTSNASGTGPFALQHYNADNHEVRLKANDSYWNGAPAIESLLFTHVADENSRVESLHSGRAAVVDMLPRAVWPELEKSTDVRLQSWWGMNVCYLGMNAMHEKTRDINVRRAIRFAIDREQLLELYYGTARPTHSLVAQLFAEYDPTYRAPDTDAAIETRQNAARSLLKQAGAEDRKLTIYFPADERPYLPTPAKVADKIRQQLNAVGLQVNIQQVPNRELFESVRNGKYELVLIGWMSDNGDPDNFYGPLAGGDGATKTPSANNTSRVFDPIVHEGIISAQSIVDKEQRIAAYRAIERRLQEEIVGYVPLVNTRQAIALSKKIEGVDIDPLMGTYTFHKAKLVRAN